MKILGFRVPLPRTKAPAPAGSDKTHAGGPSAGVLAAARAGSHRGPQDATLVSAGEKPAPGAPRLVVTRGPRKGTELALLHDVATLGRGRENSLVIPDISVSRRHARLQRAGGRWRVLDEGSGNGILVNGAPEHGCLLRDGDEIALGDTRLQFVDSGGVVARGRPAARRLRSVAPLAVACCLAAGVLAAAGIVHLRRTRHAAEMARDHHQQSRALAQRQLHAGTTLLSAGRKAEARIKLAVASELDPADAEIAHAMDALVREEAAGSQAPPPASRKEPAAAATVRPHHIRAAKAAPPPHAAAANPQPADAGLQAARSAYLRGDLAGAAAPGKGRPRAPPRTPAAWAGGIPADPWAPFPPPAPPPSPPPPHPPPGGAVRARPASPHLRGAPLAGPPGERPPPGPPPDPPPRGRGKPAPPRAPLGPGRPPQPDPRRDRQSGPPAAL